MARLSQEDARGIAMRASDTAMEEIEGLNERVWPDDYERVADDIAEGFARVLKAVELP